MRIFKIFVRSGDFFQKWRKTLCAHSIVACTEIKRMSRWVKALFCRGMSWNCVNFECLHYLVTSHLTQSAFIRNKSDRNRSRSAVGTRRCDHYDIRSVSQWKLENSWWYFKRVIDGDGGTHHGWNFLKTEIIELIQQHFIGHISNQFQPFTSFYVYIILRVHTSIYRNLSCLQLVQNTLACVVAQTPQSCHNTPVLMCYTGSLLTRKWTSKLLSLLLRYCTTKSLLASLKFTKNTSHNDHFDPLLLRPSWYLQRKPHWFFQNLLPQAASIIWTTLPGHLSSISTLLKLSKATMVLSHQPPYHGCSRQLHHVIHLVHSSAVPTISNFLQFSSETCYILANVQIMCHQQCYHTKNL